MTIDRRSILRAGMGGLFAVGAAGHALAAPAKSAPGAERSVLALARDLLAQNASRIAKTDMAAIVNFAVPSWKPRFHLVDMNNGRVSSYLVSHGRGSDPGHTGWLKSFSNRIGSNASSDGVYRTGETYFGKHGRSMRLAGLDPDNSNAEARAIVIHAAWYVSDQMITEHGKLGRSEGCFALSDAVLGGVLDRLGPGQMIYAGKF